MIDGGGTSLTLTIAEARMLIDAVRKYDRVFQVGRSVHQHGHVARSHAERRFAARMGATTVEIPSSHLPMVSHPNEVADLIAKAANAVGVPAATR